MTADRAAGLGIGPYLAVIQATGAYGNDGDALDADRILALAVAELRRAGHRVERAELLPVLGPALPLDGSDDDTYHEPPVPTFPVRVRVTGWKHATPGRYPVDE